MTEEQASFPTPDPIVDMKIVLNHLFAGRPAGICVVAMLEMIDVMFRTAYAGERNTEARRQLLTATQEILGLMTKAHAEMSQKPDG